MSTIGTSQTGGADFGDRNKIALSTAELKKLAQDILAWAAGDERRSLGGEGSDTGEVELPDGLGPQVVAAISPNLSSLTPEEQEVILAWAKAEADYPFHSPDDHGHQGAVTRLLDIAANYSSLQESVREKFLPILEEQVAHVVFDLRKDADGEPVLNARNYLENEIFSRTDGQPKYGSATGWLLETLKSAPDYILYERNTDDLQNACKRAMPESGIPRDPFHTLGVAAGAASQRVFFDAVVEAEEILRPKSPQDCWSAPVEELQKAVGIDSSPVRLNPYFETELHREATLHLLGGVAGAVKAPHFGIAYNCGLLFRIESLLDKNTVDKTHPFIQERIVDFLNTRSGLPLNKFFDLDRDVPPDAPVLVFLRSLQELGAEKGITFFGDVAPKGGVPQLSLGWLDRIPNFVPWLDASSGVRVPKQLTSLNYLQVILQAASNVGQKHGAGPFGVCALDRERIEKLCEHSQQFLQPNLVGAPAFLRFPAILRDASSDDASPVRLLLVSVRKAEDLGSDFDWAEASIGGRLVPS